MRYIFTQFFNLTAKPNEWLQIDLKIPKFVTGVITQGNRRWNERVTSFNIKYSNTTNSFWFVTDEARNPLVSKNYSITTNKECFCTIFLGIIYFILIL